MDIGGWLRKVGLEQYEPAFRENKIDREILPRLTVDDLKDLGVALVGDRRRILEAIASLRGEAASTGEGIAPINPTVRDDGDGSLGTAERRQLTVMFCDLVGSTALSARLDPEDMREIMARIIAAARRRSPRPVALSPSTWATACLPTSAIRKPTRMTPSTRCGADLRWSTRVPKLQTSHRRYPCRCASASPPALVVVGDLIGEGAAQEQAVVGETPNLAARLQTLAEPGSGGDRVKYADG